MMIKCLQALSIVLLALACDAVSSPGNLEVSWRTGRLSCSESGVEQVTVELHDFDGADAAASATARCDQQSARLEDVPAGDYALLLKGLDGDGCWTHSARRDDVTVSSGDDSIVASLPLLRRTRPLQIRWPFGNELDCTGNEVEQVAVTIEVEDMFSRSDVYRCEGLARKVTDIPRGALRVWIYALDSDEQAVAYGEILESEPLFDSQPCEDEIDVRVELEMCATAGCE